MSALFPLAGCGGDGPTPAPSDAAVVLDVSTGDTDAVLADSLLPSDVRDTGADTFQLPPIQSWLLLTPNEGFGTIAVQPALAWDGAGRLAVVWTGRVGDVSGIMGGLFEMARTPVAVTGPDMLTSIETGLRNEPRLCNLAPSDGPNAGFIGVWSADLQNGGTNNLGIYTRRFDADLSPTTSTESLVETGREGNHWLASLACASNGGFVVGGVRAGTGAGFEAFAQRYDGGGLISGEPLVGLERELGGQLFPAVATDADDVWLAWEDTPTAEAESGIMVRRFGAAGVAANAVALDDIFARPAGGPVVAASGGSVLIAANGATGMRLAWSQKGEGFKNVTLPVVDSSAAGAAIAAIGPGRYAVVWTRSAAGTNRDLRFGIVADGVLVDAPITLANGKFTAAYRPAIVVRDGRLAIAFTESVGAGAYNVRVALASL